MVYATKGTVFLFLSLLTCYTNAHSIGLGICPKVEPMKNFDMEKFMGNWYVIQKFATSSTCMKYNFTSDDDGKLRLVQTRQHFILDTVGINNIYTYTGVLSTPDPEVPASMRVKFPMNVAGSSLFNVFMTDYSTYAGIFTCQKILFGHVKSATILSRNPTLDKAIINQIRHKLEEEGVDPNDFSIVDQTKCISNAKVNVNIDEKTFSPKNVADVVKRIGAGLGTGIQKAGDFVGKGVTKASDFGAGVVESFDEEKLKKAQGSKRKLNNFLNKVRQVESDAEWIP